MIPIKFRHNFVKWSKFSSCYAFVRYTHTTKNAKVKYVGNSYRNLLLAERLCLIGLGTVTAPILLPFTVMYDISGIECEIQGLDPEKAGFLVSNKRVNWTYYL